MWLVELAVQGVRGFSPAARVPLKPGYSVLKSPGALPAPVAGLVVAICYPDGRAGDVSFLAPGAKTGKAGFSLQANDQSSWRIVRDLGGAGTLHKLNPATGQYEVVTQDSSEMVTVLRQSVGFVPRSTFEQLFTLTAQQFPTKRPKVRPGAKPAPSGLSSAAPDLGAFDVEAAYRQLATLEKEREQAKEVGELQFRLDGLQGELFTAEARLRDVEAARAEAAAVRAELEQAPTPKSLKVPEDIVERARRLKQEQQRRNAALEKLEVERAAAEVIDERPYVPTLHKDERFMLAMVSGLALLVLSSFLEGGLRYLALLALPLFSFAALLGLRFVEELQQASGMGSKIDVFEARKKKIEDEYNLFAAQVQAAMDLVSATTVDEFVTTMGRHAEIAERGNALTLRWADVESDPENQGLPEKVAALKQEAEETNTRIQEFAGGYAREVREVERDINRIKERLRRVEKPEAEAQFAPVPTGPSETFEDPTPALLVLAADLFALDPGGVWALLKDRAAQYLTALSDRRYHALELDRDNHLAAVAPGRRVSVTELPAKDLDLTYLSLRLTLVEKYSVKFRVPFILEDVLADVVDEPKRVLLGKMLKHLGTLTQVLHVTGSGQTEGSADTTVTV